MLDDFRRRRAVGLQHVLDQIDAPARAVEFVAEQHIGRAGRGAEAAMHAGAQDLFGGVDGGVGELGGGKIRLHRGYRPSRMRPGLSTPMRIELGLDARRERAERGRPPARTRRRGRASPPARRPAWRGRRGASRRRGRSPAPASGPASSASRLSQTRPPPQSKKTSADGRRVRMSAATAERRRSGVGQSRQTDAAGRRQQRAEPRRPPPRTPRRRRRPAARRDRGGFRSPRRDRRPRARDLRAGRR